MWHRSYPSVLALPVLCFVALGGCTSQGIEHGMEDQPKVNPMTTSDFFSDGRAARQIVAGTVSRGHEKEDTLLYTGKVNGKEADIFPFPVTRAILERGRERFDINCAVCHARTGQGDGVVIQRGFPHPPSYYTEDFRKMPVGHYFDVMTNGFGTMYSAAERVSVEDRWAIAAYIRALQASRMASLEDVPEPERTALENSHD
jgi:hypothetical protein